MLIIIIIEIINKTQDGRNKMSLLNEIEKNKNLRSIFGEKELIIIKKQILGVNLMPSEKTRLSRDIKKKLEAIKSLAPFADGFHLKKASIIKKIIEETKNVIFEDYLFKNITEIILFGSASERKLSFKSDIDIAVKFDKINIKEATKFRIRISGKLPDKVDIQVYNILPLKIQKEIDKKGKVLWGG